MAAHRYWRIYITATWGGTVAGITHWHLYGASDASQRFQLNTANLTSSGSQSTNTPDKVADHLSSSFWLSLFNGLPAWIQYDAGAGNAIDVVGHLIQASTGSVNYAPKDFLIQWSDDGAAWTTQFTVTGHNGTDYAGHLWGMNPRGKIVGISQAEALIPGRHKIVGTADRLGVPGKYRVRLTLKATGVVCRQQWSNEDGSFVFDHISADPDLYFLECYDHNTPPAAAACSDQVITEPMP